MTNQFTFPEVVGRYISKFNHAYEFSKGCATYLHPIPYNPTHKTLVRFVVDS